MTRADPGQRPGGGVDGVVDDAGERVVRCAADRSDRIADGSDRAPVAWVDRVGLRLPGLRRAQQHGRGQRPRP